MVQGALNLEVKVEDVVEVDHKVTADKAEIIIADIEVVIIIEENVIMFDQDQDLYPEKGKFNLYLQLLCRFIYIIVS